MDTRSLADRADALLAQAGAARADGHGERCLLRLQQAAALVAGDDPQGPLAPLRHRIAWRIAKAGYDFDDPDAMLDGLDPLLAEGAPFAHVPAGRRALAAIATRWWDTRGYADDRIPRLFDALARVHADEVDPWLAATARAKLAWHHACAGDLEALDAIIEHTLGLDPKRFGTGPHRHPSASDAPSSVWWAQLEVTRTGLWSAVWTRRRDRARDLVDALLDAAEAARLDVHSDVWFLDPLARAGIAFSLDDLVADVGTAWVDALDALDGPRPAFHHALAEGLLASHNAHPAYAIDALERALALADSHILGPEWRIDVRLELARIVPDPQRESPLREQARNLGAQFGVGWATDVTRA